MPNLAQQAAINVGSLPSDIEALNQVTKYHDDTVARQRELTQLSRGQIDLARASDDLHSGRLEAQRRIDEEEAWKNDQQSIIENMANLDYTADDYQEQLAIQISGLSETALKSPAVQLMTKAGLERSAGYKSQQATGRELNRVQAREAGLSASQSRDVSMAKTAEEGREITENYELDNATSNTSTLFSLGAMTLEGKRRSDYIFTEGANTPEGRASALNIARAQRAATSNYMSTVANIEKLKASAEDKEYKRAEAKAKFVYSNSISMYKEASKNVLQLEKSFGEKYGGDIPEEGDPLYDKYVEDQSLLSSSRAQLSQMKVDSDNAKLNYLSTSSSPVTRDASVPPRYAPIDKGRASARTKDKDPTDMVKSLTGQ